MSKSIIKIIATIFIVFLTVEARSQNFTIALFNSTYKIMGPSKNDSNSTTAGTSFVIGIPIPNTNTSRFVLITARHVLDDIDGDVARLDIRRKINDEKFEIAPWIIPIRKNGKNLYITHPSDSIDIAALKITLPKDNYYIELLTTDFLMTDSLFKEIEISPGDELMCLGFPEGVSANDEGFPILRTGAVSSYPLFPSKYIKKFYYDVEVFPGNSGGPVYMSTNIHRNKEANINLGSFNYIVGVFSSQVTVEKRSNGISSPLKIGVVIPSQFIIETLNQFK